ncbi:hypothetical protein BJX76DRAFT_219447 [Aspergillus varians]
MIWTTSFFSLLVALLFITTVNALPTAYPSSSSFYATILTNFLQFLDVTNCPFGDAITLPKSTLPPPSDGLSLKSITLGRGTQNYTCASATNTTKPVATGATATLFDASCIAALDTDNSDTSKTQSLLHILPDVLRPIPLSSTDLLANILNRLTNQNLDIGRHYFTADGTPFFDLRGWNSSDSDWIAAKMEDDMAAPARPGYGITKDVPWLKLTHVDGGLREVYRVHTSGGSAPATCEGMPEELTVDYTAEYWFYG